MNEMAAEMLAEQEKLCIIAFIELPFERKLQLLRVGLVGDARPDMEYDNNPGVVIVPAMDIDARDMKAVMMAFHVELLKDEDAAALSALLNHFGFQEHLNQWRKSQASPEPKITILGE